MITIVVVGEGQSEEMFIKQILAPAMWVKDLSLEPRLIWTSKTSGGGALAGPRVVQALRDVLLQRSDTYVTTFFDLYGLPNDFPGSVEAGRSPDPHQRAAIIEHELAGIVLSEAGCPDQRFIPHIQPYEFEALLFSEPGSIAAVHPEWGQFAKDLREARASAPSPEHINDGATTHPSARLERILTPRYRKPLDGSLAAEAVGVPRMRQECVHFDQWLLRLEALPPLAPED